MAYIVQKRADMIGLVNQAIAKLQAGKGEMLILPFMLVEDAGDAAHLLLEAPKFVPATRSSTLPAGSAGTIIVNARRTVHDALDDLESLSVVNVSDVSAILKCATENYVKGKTRRVRMPIGECIVDLSAFAEATGLPMKSNETIDYCVFIVSVPDTSTGDDRAIMVAVKGLSDIAGGEGGEDSALDSLLPRMEARMQAGFEPGASFYARDLENGWQLFHNARFKEALAWFKRGYSYVVEVDEDKGGLNISY